MITYRLTSAAEVARLTTLVIGDQRGMGCPCSRYGRYTEDVAPFAVAAAIVIWELNGQDDDEQITLDETMSLAVNDHPDIATMITDYWYVIPRGLRQELGGLRHVRTLV